MRTEYQILGAVFVLLCSGTFASNTVSNSCASSWFSKSIALVATEQESVRSSFRNRWAVPGYTAIEHCKQACTMAVNDTA